MTFQTEKIEIIVKINVKIFLYDKTNLHNFLLKLSLAFHNNNSWKSVFMNALFLSIFFFIDFIPWRCDVLELQVTCTQVIFIWINVNLFRFFLFVRAARILGTITRDTSVLLPNALSMFHRHENRLSWL